MQPTLFTISREGSGQLSTMTRPRGGDWLADELASLATAGVTVLVSLLSDAEVSELELGAEPDAALASAIEFYRLPTADLQVPDRAGALALAQVLRQKLRDGASIVVHCRHGIGRSSTLAALVMVLEGTNPDLAWERIEAARGLPVPDTSAQREFPGTCASID
jgi:protein-tyrosine phosphatase